MSRSKHPFAGERPHGALVANANLSRWKPLLAYLPVETVIREQQAAYYQALAESDSVAEATPFVTFMLQALLTAMGEAALTDQVSEQVSDQVKRLLAAFRTAKALKAAELMARLGLQHRPTFRNNYLNPALAAGLVEMTQPDSPRSPAQQYRLTAKGRAR